MYIVWHNLEKRLYFKKILIYIGGKIFCKRINRLKKNRYKFKKQKVQYSEKKPFLADKEIIFRSGGRAKVFNISHRLQVWFLLIMGAIFCWSGYNYYAYHHSAHVIHKKERELGKTRDAYMDLMSDVSVLQNNLKDVVAAVEEAGNSVSELQEYKNEALKMEDKIKLITNSETWIDTAKVEDKVTKKEALIQKDIALKENNILRDKIGSLSTKVEDLQHTVKGLETAEMAILDKIEKMSGKEIEDIKKSLGQINQSLRQQKQYFNPLSNVKDGKGGKYLPLDGINISKELQDKMSSTFNRIDQLDKYKTAMCTVPLGKPVYKYRLSSEFGNRSDPLEKRIARHKGVDFSAAKGSRISAPAAGKVLKAEFNGGGYGNYVEIDHGNGFVTRYAHLNKMYVKKGERVKYNQAIGEVGRTGRATGCHLHYEVLYNGRNVNPLTFVNIPSMNEL
jgi:murein DD-endopeptidase MepM/ murein hydrolase activator NlpD